jgi:hypothetical protein
VVLTLGKGGVPLGTARMKLKDVAEEIARALDPVGT